MATGTTLDQLRDRIELITFDCYGTLVDWESGLRAAVRKVAGRNDPAVFDAYLEIEAGVEAEEYRLYRDVLEEVLSRLGDRFGFEVPPEKSGAFAETLPDWPLWPDTREALARLKQRYRIGVLSNIDRDLFAGTARHLGIELDLLVTADDVRSYKPSHRHFKRMLSEIGGNCDVVLHAAQSLYHDCVPATELAINNVWINRRNESNQTTARPLATFKTVADMAEALGT